jgi:hypothetical protein
MDAELQLNLVKAQKALRDFDYQTRANRSALQKAMDDAQYAFANANVVAQVDTLQKAVDAKKAVEQVVEEKI